MTAGSGMHDEAPRERYRGDRVELASHIPQWVRSVLVAGWQTGLFCGIIGKSYQIPVTAIETDPAHFDLVSRVADRAVPAGFNVEAEFEARQEFDLAVILDPSPWRDDWPGFLARLKQLLHPDGAGVLLLCETGSTPGPDWYQTLAADAGWLPYQHWPNAANPGPYVLHWLVPPGYDAVGRAEQLRCTGHSDWAYNELMNQPDSRIADPAVATATHSLALACLADVAESSDPTLGKDFLLRAQGHHYHVILHDPGNALVQESYARVLDSAGAHALAARMRGSFRIAYPDAKSLSQESSLPSNDPAFPWESQMDSHFVWPGAIPRVLYLIHPAPHYGLDVLYDGLCAVLGDAQVCEWPPKPSLHGALPEQLAYYPCSFSRPVHALGFQQIRQQLIEGRFDVLLFADCECELPAEPTQEIVQLARERGIPIVLLDQMDETMDYRPRVLPHLGITHFDLHFKREMVTFIAYGPGTWPLPFSFSRSKIRPHDFPRSEDLFWAGHRQFGLRRLYLEYLERALSTDLSQLYTPDEYAARMAASTVGLSLFGKGYDTVRYWELAAHGCMLLSERLPMHVPHNFIDGQSAVFFDTLGDLEEKLQYYRDRPAEAAAIARAGEAHFLNHHTSEARARQMLHVLYDVCFRRTP